VHQEGWLAAKASQALIVFLLSGCAILPTAGAREENVTERFSAAGVNRFVQAVADTREEHPNDHLDVERLRGEKHAQFRSCRGALEHAVGRAGAEGGSTLSSTTRVSVRPHTPIAEAVQVRSKEISATAAGVRRSRKDKRCTIATERVRYRHLRGFSRSHMILVM
jgi:hypothetical protein